jgi:hypothetical protein
VPAGRPAGGGPVGHGGAEPFSSGGGGGQIVQPAAHCADLHLGSVSNSPKVIINAYTPESKI